MATTKTTKETPRPPKRDFEESFGPIKPFDIDHEGESPRLANRHSPFESDVPVASPARAVGDGADAKVKEQEQEGEREVSPAGSMASSLSDLGSRSTPSLGGDAPVVETAFAALNGNRDADADANRLPAAKKPKLTFAEKEARRMEKVERDEERKREREKKKGERLALLEERRRRERERDEERRKKDEEKEAERKRKEEEKAAKEERKRLKDEEKRKKDEEKQRIEDEKKKKAASQKTLSSFFGTPASAKASKDEVTTSPASAGLTMAAPPTTRANSTTPSKKEISPYEKMFPPFFVQNGVRLAPINHFERDDEASQALQATIDAYIYGNQSPGKKRYFDAAELFHLSPHRSLKRGKSIIAVRDIMAELSGNPLKPIDLTTDSQNSQIKRTRAQLKDVRIKYLKFQEDVRPPYHGTYTHTPMCGVSKLARNPMRRDLPNTNYDYDSEAEWIEDEDAEDLNSEGEEDEEGLDDVEDMDGFLDDENDELLNSRRALGGIQGDLEPVSTGLCWEDRKKRSTNVKVMPYRMEFIIGTKIKSIDPFSTEYWDPIAPPVQTGTMQPPRLPLNAMKSTNTLQASPSPSTSSSASSNSKVSNHKTVPLSFFGSPPSTATTSTLPLHQGHGGADAKPKKFLPDEDLPAFKEAIQGSDLSKLGLVEVLKKKFPGRTGGAIKATLDLVAKRVGGKEVEKRWVLI
ncbi:hypothetical protein DSL72_005740 [Monilinia vaccinii-corymbosi]|uniref:Chromatin assembly factor 1 subunit A n=1 Tax=Monilinia vaccinii-corymbosi TaxID=61207 RepID=A0A8A3PFX7_9HELO|nr:hypothetical protein DSL72_005740 [Monilinia vaccinii-corymbosi]